MKKLFIDDLPVSFFKGKRVLLRADYNVPIKNGQIKEDYRIRQTLPTIEYLSKQGAKIIIISHLGRPGGVVDSKLSLSPVADRLSDILDEGHVKFADECIGKNVNQLVNRLHEGEVLLLENLRFQKEEEENDKEFCKQFSKLADVYVNDAFSTSHRVHASTYGIAKQFDHRLGGFLLKNEICNLDKMIQNPIRPFIAVIGGSKVKEKIAAISSLVRYADKIILGGCVANTFLIAKGRSVGDSYIEYESVDNAKKIIRDYGDKIILPDDFLIQQCDQRDILENIHFEVPLGKKIMDIGRDTTIYYNSLLLNNKGMIFWCGPMGQFEVDEFARGTDEIAKSLSHAHWRGAYTVIGGGDTIAAIRRADVPLNEVDFVSTGGSAALKYLAGVDLAGISVLSQGIVPKKYVVDINYKGEAACL